MFIVIFIGLLVLIGIGGVVAPTFIKDGKSGVNHYGREVEGEDRSTTRIATKWSGVGVLAVAGLLFGLNSFYTQDPGEAKVIRSWTGDISGQSTTEGLKFKAPWEDVLNYDIRNQQVIFALEATGRDGNERPNGAQITIQDREGVTANIDITVRYSVKPDAVTEIYKKYGSQENFVAKFIENDIRAAVRTIPAKYQTLELLNSRAKVELDIVEYLEERWNLHGVTVETVSLQEIRYPDDVKQRFADAQASRIRVEQAKADLEAAEVNAQQKVVQAEAEAKANKILTASLTPAVLQQRYLDTLKELAQAGNLVITDGKSTPLINVGK